MKEWLFLDGVGKQRGDGTVDQGHQFPVLVLSSPAPPVAAGRDLTSPLAGQAANLPTNRLLEKRWSDELFGGGCIKTEHT